MGRLIDDDRFKQWIENTFGESQDSLILTLQGFIADQPTAYDMDKVVNQLNDEFRVVRTDEDLEWNRAMYRAITIVKGGGVDGN